MIEIRLPSWLKIKYVKNQNSNAVENTITKMKLHTVCQSAHCPNKTECWANGTATFMIMGEYCTRGCKFCAVKTMAKPPPLDELEPKNLAEAVLKLKLKHVVITSVDRDDLEDDGAEHFAKCIRKIRRTCPDIIIETLIPDFKGEKTSIDKVIIEKPNVISHNIETVERISPKIRDKRANYYQSLQVLGIVHSNSIIAKSGIMLGLGESKEEVEKTMDDLLSVGVKMLTIGQYLPPSKLHYPLVTYIEPGIFNEYEKIAYKKGFTFVASGPFVRSSYRAWEPFLSNP